MIEEVRRALNTIFENAKKKMGDEIKSWNKVFQFNIAGGEPFYVEFSGGEMKVEAGTHPSPLATLTMDREVLEKILKGELDAMAAFIRGKMRITGNVIETTHLRRIIEEGRE